MMHSYKISLEPLSKYFFGGEHHYDEDDNVFYFQKSRAFPQQTTLLGAIRYQLLLQGNFLEQSRSGLTIPNTKLEDAHRIIGKESFNESAQQKFGKIEKLSPVFIGDQGGKEWFELPYLVKKEGGFQETKFKFLETTSDVFLGNGGIKKSCYEIPEFDHKEGFRYNFKVLDGTDTLNREKVFQKEVADEEQIGIYKSYRKKGKVEKTEQEGFYKYQFQQLAEGLNFSFYIKTNEPLKLKDRLIRMGKERSLFKMTIQDASDPYVNVKFKPRDVLLLLSDAALENDWPTCADAYVGEPLSFKNVRHQTQENKDSYYAKPFQFKQRRNLLKKGSLLVVSKDTAKAERLYKQFNESDLAKAYQKIGYNHYTILKNRIVNG